MKSNVSVNFRFLRRVKVRKGEKIRMGKRGSSCEKIIKDFTYLTFWVTC